MLRLLPQRHYFANCFQFQRVPCSALHHVLPPKSRPNIAGAQQRSLQAKPIPITQHKEIPCKLSLAPVPIQSIIIPRLKAIIAGETGIELGN